MVEPNRAGPWARGTGGAAARLKEAPVINDAVRQRTAEARKTQDKKAVDERFAAIESNPFFKIIANRSLKPEQQRAEIAKLLTFASTRQEMRERVKEFELCKEYLSTQREEMAQEIIRLTDDQTFSELKAVYDQMHGDLVGFEEDMRPLTEILDALYTLRTNGVTFDALRDIKADKEFERQIAEERSQLEKHITAMTQEMSALAEDDAVRSTQKSLFGFGGLTREAQEAIARNSARRAEIEARLEEEKKRIEDINRRATERQGDGKFAAEKAKLRELLDISSEEHQERVQNVVKSALRFVTTSKERVGSIRLHLERMSGQIDNLFDLNNRMTTIYATMTEGVNDATKENLKIRTTLAPPAGAAEDLLAKMQREQKEMDLDAHVKALGDSAQDTTTSYADLQSQSIRIKTMKDANDMQISRSRTLHTQGIAGVADRLSVVLQAVSQASLGESSAMAGETLQRMHESTNQVAQKEVIRVATAVDEDIAEVKRRLDDLGGFQEALVHSTELRRKGLSEMQQAMQDLKRMSEETRDQIREARSVDSEVQSDAPNGGRVVSENKPNPLL
jgi:hypothetical protein